MERYYIFFRCWEHFSADFPFEKFDDYSDDEINGELEACAVNWRRENKSEFDRRVRETEKKLSAALRSRAKQRTRPPGADPAIADEPEEVIFDTSKPLEDIRAFRRALGLNPHPAENIQFEPGPKCSLGCRNAYNLGWITAPLRHFGDLSPSPQWFVVSAEGEQCAKEAANTLDKLLPRTDGWGDYSHLRIRFGYVPADRFETAKRIEIELSMEDLSILKPESFAEDVQQQIADVAQRVVGKVSDKLRCEVEVPETPPDATTVADQAEGGDTGTPASASATAKPPRAATAEDAPGSGDATVEQARQTTAGSHATHSPDFRSVRWNDKKFSFTKQQSTIIKLLWNAWLNRTPDVGAEALLEEADAKNSRLIDGFRNHPAWGTMIVNGQTRDAKRIAGDPPQS